MTKTIDRVLNGAGVHYPHPVVGLGMPSIVSCLLTDIGKLNQRKLDERIGDARFAGMLEGKTETINGLSHYVTSPALRQEILSTVGGVWEKSFTSDQLERMLEKHRAPNPYAGLIAAFGDNSVVSDMTKSMIVGAIELDKLKKRSGGMSFEDQSGAGVIAR